MDGCASEDLQDMTGAQSESMQALATARQLIVDGAENLQVCNCIHRSKCILTAVHCMFDACRGVSIPIRHILWYEITAYYGLLRCLDIKSCCLQKYTLAKCTKVAKKDDQ